MTRLKIEEDLPSRRGQDSEWEEALAALAREDRVESVAFSKRIFGCMFWGINPIEGAIVQSNR